MSPSYSKHFFSLLLHISSTAFFQAAHTGPLVDPVLSTASGFGSGDITIYNGAEAPKEDIITSTPDSMSLCSDSLMWAQFLPPWASNADSRRDCSWVGERPQTRCNPKVVNSFGISSVEACQKTCGTCSSSYQERTMPGVPLKTTLSPPVALDNLNPNCELMGLCYKVASSRLYVKNTLTSTLDIGCFDNIEFEQLYITNNANLIKLEPGLFRDLKIKSLHLENNLQLQSLPEELFNGLTVDQLFIRYNPNLTILPQKLFKGLTITWEIHISGNDALERIREGLFCGMIISHYYSRIFITANPSLTTIESNAFSALQPISDGSKKGKNKVNPIDSLSISGNPALTTIKKGAFRGFGCYTLLLERNNVIRTMFAGLFHGLDVGELYITENKNLRTLQLGIFSNSNIGSLYIQESPNLILEQSNLFAGLSLKQFFIWHCDKIQIFPDGLFRNLKVDTLLIGENAGLVEIDPGVFDGLQAMSLELTGNDKLKMISSGLIKNMKIKTLKIVNNPSLEVIEEKFLEGSSVTLLIVRNNVLLRKVSRDSGGIIKRINWGSWGVQIINDCTLTREKKGFDCTRCILGYQLITSPSRKEYTRPTGSECKEKSVTASPSAVPTKKSKVDHFTKFKTVKSGRLVVGLCLKREKGASNFKDCEICTKNHYLYKGVCYKTGCPPGTVLSKDNKEYSHKQLKCEAQDCLENFKAIADEWYRKKKKKRYANKKKTLSEFVKQLGIQIGLPDRVSYEKDSMRLFCSEKCPIAFLGDGECDPDCFTELCNFDGGDCRQHNDCAPGCLDEWLGDGFCDARCFTKTCFFDKGDCSKLCSPGCPNTWKGDGICDDECKTDNCNYDGGDCSSSELEVFKFESDECSPGCTKELLKNSKCDKQCFTDMCNLDNGDCTNYCSPLCNIKLLGNGICDEHCNNAFCSFDMGDCNTNPCSAVPRPFPTPELISCMDDNTWSVKKRGIEINCAWVQKEKKSRRCMIKDKKGRFAAEFCPRTCGICENYNHITNFEAGCGEENSSWVKAVGIHTQQLLNKTNRTCSPWVAENPKTRCSAKNSDGVEAKSVCLACGRCAISNCIIYGPKSNCIKCKNGFDKAKDGFSCVDRCLKRDTYGNCSGCKPEYIEQNKRHKLECVKYSGKKRGGSVESNLI